jgi:eukaryotic-like serine/threonine-protein kinase
MATEPVPFGRYRLLNLLGEGGMAKVYRAVLSGPMGFEKEVALKRLDRKLTEDERVVKALINEARLGGQLRHKNIVEIYEFNEVDGNYFMAMEYVNGWTLDTIIRRCRIRSEFVPGTVVVEILGSICRGLDYAHTLIHKDGQPLNLVHRDLKPGNLILSRDGDVKIMDFGIAKSDTNLYKTTAADVTKGTPIYMSPEQVTGSTLDHRSDIFSLGSIIHELVTLQVPFMGDNLLAIMHAILGAEIGPARERVRRLEPGLEPVLARCMARDPGERYQSSKELGQGLRDARRHLKPGPSLDEWLEDLAVELPPATSTGEFGPDGAPLAARGKPAEGTQSLASVDKTGEKPVGPQTEAAGDEPTPLATDAVGALDDTAEVNAWPSGEEDPDVSLDTHEERFFDTDGGGTPPDPNLYKTRLQKSVPGRSAPRRRRKRKQKTVGVVWVIAALLGVAILAVGSLAIKMYRDAQTAEVGPSPTATAEVDRETPIGLESLSLGPGEVQATPAPTPRVTPRRTPRPTPRPTTTPRPTPRATPTPKATPTPITRATPTPTATPVTALTAKGSGTVRLNSVPWSTVIVDGKNLGSSPVMGYKLSAGDHQVTFDCSACEPPQSKTVKVTVVAGQETKKIIRFEQK